MAEFQFHETIISAPSGQAFLRVFADDLTGAPIRAEMQNTTPNLYTFYVGLANRSVKQTEPLTSTQKNVTLVAGVTSLINVLCAEGQVGCVADWMCGLEGG